MKKMITMAALALVAASLATSVVFAEDKANTKSDETTTSTNMMGTKTTKHKMKKHVKHANGEGGDATVTETTKVDKDGKTVKKSVEIKADSTEKH
jgi:hypothetical protein